MINSQKRELAMRLLQDFLSGKITNDDVENEFPFDKRDPALGAIYERLWFLWDSRHTQVRASTEPFSTVGDALFRRCIAFLRSDLEYDWPAWGAGRISFGIGLLRALGWRKTADDIAESRLSRLWGKEADALLWPFKRQEDMEKYMSST